MFDKRTETAQSWPPYRLPGQEHPAGIKGAWRHRPLANLTQLVKSRTKWFIRCYNVLKSRPYILLKKTYLRSSNSSSSVPRRPSRYPFRSIPNRRTNMVSVSVRMIGESLADPRFTPGCLCQQTHPSIAPPKSGRRWLLARSYSALQCAAQRERVYSIPRKNIRDQFIFGTCRHLGFYTATSLLHCPF